MVPGSLSKEGEEKIKIKYGTGSATLERLDLKVTRLARNSARKNLHKVSIRTFLAAKRVSNVNGLSAE